MSLEERVAEAVRTHTDIVTPPSTNVPGLLRRARRHRRARAAGVICSAVAVGAIAVAVSIPGQDKRTDPPAVDRAQGDRSQVVTRRDGVAVVPDIRDEQVVVTPDIHPSDLEKEELLGSASTTEDKYAGATDLTVKVPVFTEEIRWRVYCAGAPDLHYIFTIDPNASYFETGSCGGTAPTKFPPAPRDYVTGMDYSANRRADPGRPGSSSPTAVHASTRGATSTARPVAVTTSRPSRPTARISPSAWPCTSQLHPSWCACSATTSPV